MQVKPHTESAWRAAGRWASHNVHYLGLIALMAGVGMLVASEVLASQQRTNGMFHNFPSRNFPMVVYKQYQSIDDGIQTGLMVGALLIGCVGLVFGTLAICHFRSTQKLRQNATTLPAQQEAQCQRRDWVTRALVIAAVFSLSFSIAAVCIGWPARGTTGGDLPQWASDRWPNWDPGDAMFIDVELQNCHTVYTLNQTTLTALRAISIPLMIGGACATFVGFGGHTLLTRKRHAN
jgi:hypothetical protein